MEFASPDMAKWVFEAGRRWFRCGSLHLDWWNLDSGCVKRKYVIQEAWIRVVGLPLHLWNREILKMIWDSCGGFVDLDKETTLKSKLS